MMKIKTGTLIAIADGAKLKLFRNDGDTRVPRLTPVVEEEATNLPAHMQGTDSPGRTHSRIGDQRSSYSETDWHLQMEEEFARHAADVLEQIAAGDPDAEIILAAAPRTLGEMRRRFGRATRQNLQAEIAKDMANSKPDDIVDVISTYEP